MLPPLAERELRGALRRRRAHEQWIAAAWIGGAITGIFLLSLAMTGSSGGNSGGALFRGLFALQLILIVGRGFKLTADLFSEERRNGTLGLLVLTGMKPLEIFSGKLLGAALLTAHAMIAMRPVILLMLTFMPVKSPQALAEKLARELRLIAGALIPTRGDHRFASWNPEEIFPPGRWGELRLSEPKRKKTWSGTARLLASRRRNKRA